jgi:hypothetical protein
MAAAPARGGRTHALRRCGCHCRPPDSEPGHSRHRLTVGSARETNAHRTQLTPAHPQPDGDPTGRHHRRSPLGVKHLFRTGLGGRSGGPAGVRSLRRHALRARVGHAMRRHGVWAGPGQPHPMRQQGVWTCRRQPASLPGVRCNSHQWRSQPARDTAGHANDATVGGAGPGGSPGSRSRHHHCGRLPGSRAGSASLQPPHDVGIELEMGVPGGLRRAPGPRVRLAGPTPAEALRDPVLS